MLFDVVDGGELVGVTMGTARWGGNVHDLVDVIGGRAKPAGMSHRGASLLRGWVVSVAGLRLRGALGGALRGLLGVSLFLKLLPMQGNELGAEPVIFGFQFLDALFGVAEELLEIIDLIPQLPVLLSQMLILRPDPLGR
jgi:hypothetical protein